VTDLCATDAVTLAGMLRRREVSARDVIAAYVQRIEAVDGAVNAVVTRTFDAALDQAARADEALARGAEPGPLHGLPVARKDLHDTAGVRTTYGSVLFADHVPDRDALVVHRMAQAGAISLGKTNTPEFGAGSHTVTPVFGATRNPYDLTRGQGRRRTTAAAACAPRPGRAGRAGRACPGPAPTSACRSSRQCGRCWAPARQVLAGAAGTARPGTVRGAAQQVRALGAGRPGRSAVHAAADVLHPRRARQRRARQRRARP
jgi:Amidase